MALLQQLRMRAKNAAVPVLSLCLILYFGYHSVEGRYGLISLHRLNLRIAHLETQSEILAARRAALEKKVAMLRPESLEPDLLDEEVRKSLGFVHRDEIVIYP